MSNSLRPAALQHTSLPCPSLSPGVCSDSCPLSQWCYLTISSTAALISVCLQTFPASGSVPMSRLFASSGQSIGASAPALPMSMQGWFPLGLTVLISLQSKELSRVFSNTTAQKYQFLGVQPFLWFNSHTEPKLIQTSVFDYSFCEMGWVIFILSNESLKVLEILDNTESLLQLLAFQGMKQSPVSLRDSQRRASCDSGDWQALLGSSLPLGVPRFTSQLCV